MISLENLYRRLYRREILLEKIEDLPLAAAKGKEFLRGKQIIIVNEAKLAIQTRLDELRQEMVEDREILDNMPDPTDEEVKAFFKGDDF